MHPSQLYLPELRRNYYKSEISAYSRIFNERLFPSFVNIEKEADEFADNYYEELCRSTFDESGDLSGLAEKALHKSIIYYSELRAVKYAFTAIAISSLYHIWEQQVRKFLYNEMSHTYKIEFTDFCPAGMRDIKPHFQFHNLDLEKLSCWGKIDELRLLSNVIKHGDGGSAEQLSERNKELFKQPIFKFENRPTLDSTLLEETLSLSQNLFNEHVKTLLGFWNELPERSFSS